MRVSARIRRAGRARRRRGRADRVRPDDPKDGGDGVTTLVRRDATDLTHYTPAKGLQRVAVYEAAEKHYARAKDVTKLEQAIRAKLEAQAAFVAWWDTYAEKNKGAAQKRSNRSARALTAGQDGFPDSTTIHRWRRKLAAADAFERTYTQALERARRLCESTTGPHVEQNSGEHEWYTPRDYIEAARAVMGEIDCDPASSASANAIVQATQFYTHDDNGLAQPWQGRVWMNPPYAHLLVDQFCERLAAHVSTGRVTEAVVLVNNATETRWFARLAAVASAICFPLGRVRFWSPGKDTAAPLQGQAVVYVGGHVTPFLREFGAFGLVVTVA